MLQILSKDTTDPSLVSLEATDGRKSLFCDYSPETKTLGVWILSEKWEQHWLRFDNWEEAKSWMLRRFPFE